MKSKLIREKFLKYFSDRQHKIIPSSPLVPPNDPTLLFTNAGMVQFKQYFLGQAKSPSARMVSSQCCLRAGGKHNDLDQVGYTARHHTFFEMLGSFSFGDYFKKEAIAFAWDFLINELKVPQEKLWITVYKDDQETAKIWLNDIGVDSERFSYCDEKDNFWSMGPVGPCGPCTEIFYDHGSSIEGEPPGIGALEGDRYTEIWNIVFMEYERLDSGKLVPLATKSVDTGMGLERISAVLQGVHDNYDIDVFKTLILSINALLPVAANDKIALKVIADHIRAISFLIAEGVLPSNEGRGYVLRRIIRRAIRYGFKLGLTEIFLHKLVQPLVSEMGEVYQTLQNNQDFIEKVIKTEEEHFNNTLKTGMRIFEKDLEQLSNKTISGEIVFKMYDTYGFPTDLIQDIAKERKLKVDMEKYKILMAQQKKQAQKAHKFITKTINASTDLQHTVFMGYDEIEGQGKVLNIITNEKVVDSIEGSTTVDDHIGIVLDQTPFYAESGGQVGDVGKLFNKKTEFVVQDTQSIGNTVIHYGQLIRGKIVVGDNLNAVYDNSQRIATALNHTATHLLHAALQSILGAHVKQKGSLVNNKKLRFDFVHNLKINHNTIKEIEDWVNHKIRENLSVITKVMDIDIAKKEGAIALFQEKYEEEVRVVSISDVSKELCGGTHTLSTGTIGLFKIIDESSIAAGIRRIEAITGEEAIKWLHKNDDMMQDIAGKLHCSKSEISKKIENLEYQNQELQEKLKDFNSKLLHIREKDLEMQGEMITNIFTLVAQVEDQDPQSMRLISDNLKNKYKNASIVLVSILAKEKVMVLATISKNLIGKVLPPKKIVEVICGKGGGRDDMAQGGIKYTREIDAKIQEVKSLVRNSISDQ